MFGYYSCVITALLLIYPHSTSQSILSYELDQIEKELLKDDSYRKSLSENRSDPRPIITTSDIVCDFDQYAKQDICNEAMELVITKDHGDEAFEKFVKTESDPPAPRLANQSDPYTCKTISIDGPDVNKRMYWCKDRKYKNAKTGKIDEIKGFFMSASEKIVDKVFMFRPSLTDDAKVAKWAKINTIALYCRHTSQFGENFGLFHGGGSLARSRGY